MNNGPGVTGTFVNLVFTGNTAVRYGGGIHSNSGITINGGIFQDNHSSYRGGALVFGVAGTATLRNVTMVGNDAADVGCRDLRPRIDDQGVQLDRVG